MTLEEARIVLASMCDAYDLPPLINVELDGCLIRARRPDPCGCVAGDPGYVGTYDMNYAAFLAWHLKAGKCANFHATTTQGRVFQAGEVFAHCQAMMAEYRRFLNGTLLI